MVTIATSTNPAYSAATNHLFVVRLGHDSKKFRLRYAKYIIVVLHPLSFVFPVPVSLRLKPSFSRGILIIKFYLLATRPESC